MLLESEIESRLVWAGYLGLFSTERGHIGSLAHCMAGRTVSLASNLSHTSKKNLAKSSSDIGAPLILMRSRTATRCGDVYRPMHHKLPHS